MIDINTIFSACVSSAVNEIIQPIRAHYDAQLEALQKEITELKQQRAVSPATGSDAAQSRPTADFITDVVTLLKEHADVHEAVQQLVRSEVEAAVDEALGAHCSDYDHDEYDRAVRFVDEDLPELPDFDDFVTKDELRDATATVSFRI